MRYIAHFDYLGFTNFIINNDIEHVRRRLGHLYRDMEHATTDIRKFSEEHQTVIADLETVKVNTLNFSDTVIFYTNSDSEEDFSNILNVAYKFNWTNNLFNFPVRGIIIRDEIEYSAGNLKNSAGKQIFQSSMMYGKGLGLAHLKCDAQQWAGCCVDNSVLQGLTEQSLKLLNQKAIKYPIPLKTDKYGDFADYALRLYINGANDIALKNLYDDIYRGFTSDGKNLYDSSAQEKYHNTLAYVDFLKNK